jgi:hypothetical protein
LLKQSHGKVAAMPPRFAALAMALCLALLLPAAANAEPPLVTTTAATEVEAESATLNGLVNPKGLPTTYWFEYGATSEYGLKTTEKSAGFGSSNVAVAASVKGLSPNTTYHFRVVAKNFHGLSKGQDKTFFVSSGVAITEPASGIYSKDATLNGTVNPEGLGTPYYFEYGTTEKYGSKTMEAWASGTEPVKAISQIAGLSPNTTYHYQLVAKNSKGTHLGGDRTFTTAAHTWYPQATTSLGLSKGFGSISCLSGTECIAVRDGPKAAKWNGSEWSWMSIPGTGELDSVSCSSFTACTAVGITWAGEHYAPLVERWNGSEWKIQEAPTPAGAISTALHGVSCTSSTHCVAVGRYWTGGEGNWWPMAMVWNGSEWKLQAVPAPVGKIVNYLYDVSCFSSTACTAVGYSSMDHFAVRWNGTEWKVQAPPKVGGFFESVSCPSATSCMAVGLVNSYEPSSFDPYAARWTGSEWVTLSVPVPSGSEGGNFQGVSCSSASACSAVGHWNAGPRGYLLAESWDGSSWQIQPTAEPSGTESAGFNDVACISAFDCVAGGGYTKGLSGYTLASRFE